MLAARLTSLIGPSGRTPALGTKAMCEHMKKMRDQFERCLSTTRLPHRRDREPEGDTGNRKED